jgi:hypothetical protein
LRLLYFPMIFALLMVEKGQAEQYHKSIQW